MHLFRKKQFKITANIISDVEANCRKSRNFIRKEKEKLQCFKNMLSLDS
jgi:hypothetical protein